MASAYLILAFIIALVTAVGFSAGKLTKLLRELRKGGQSAFEVNVQFRMFPQQPPPPIEAPKPRDSLPPVTKPE